MSGLVAVGDAAACTTPSLGRGIVDRRRCRRCACATRCATSPPTGPTSLARHWHDRDGCRRLPVRRRHASASTPIVWRRWRRRSTACRTRPTIRRGRWARRWPAAAPCDPDLFRAFALDRRRPRTAADVFARPRARRAATVRRRSAAAPGAEPGGAARYHRRGERGGPGMRIDVNGVGLEVSDEGSGPAVVLLHGWPDSHAMWRHQVAALTAAGYRTIAPDLRGFGASDRPDGVDQYSLLYVGRRRRRRARPPRRRAGPRRRPRLGRRASPGWSARSAPTASTTSSPLSVGHPRSFGGRRPRPAREVVVHAAVPVRGRRRAVAVRRTTAPTSGRGPSTPTPTR